MTRDDLDALVADVLADHFARLRADMTAHIDRAVAARALPPFSPPASWTAGRHGAGAVVRHRNGIFSARRDTEGEPGADDGWLPLVVGIASASIDWDDDRALSIRLTMSDGNVVAMQRQFTVPIVRGYWMADADYQPGDRVFRFGEWHALQASRGIDPNAPGGEEHWLRVSRRSISFSLADDGTLSENGKAVGNLKPVVEDVLGRLVEART